MVLTVGSVPSAQAAASTTGDRATVGSDDGEPTPIEQPTEVTETTVVESANVETTETSTTTPAPTVPATVAPTTTQVPVTTAAPTTTQVPTTTPAPTTTTEVTATLLTPAIFVGAPQSTVLDAAAAVPFVTVVAVCDSGTTPMVDVTNTGTSDIRVAVGPNYVDLSPDRPFWHASWPTNVDRETGVESPDSIAKWDAVRLDTMEVFDLGTVALPADCPPRPIVASEPLGMTSTAGDGFVTLQWKAPAWDGGSPIVDYTIEHQAYGTRNWVRVDDGAATATSVTVLGLNNGTTYLFRITAVNVNGLGAPAEAKDTPRTVPSAPQSLAVAPINASGQVRLTWAAPLADGGTPIIDYIIQRSLTGTSGWTNVADGVNTATAFTVTGLTPGVRTYFRVLVQNDAGVSASSRIVNAVPLGSPSAPRSLTATPTNGSGQIRVSWTVPLTTGGAAITDYVVQRSTNGASGWTTVTEGVNTTTAFTITGLTNGSRLYVRVLARNGFGLGPASNVTNAIPRTLPSASRSLVASATGASGQIRLSWYAPVSNGGSAITDYTIQRSPNGTTWTAINDGTSTATTYTVTGLTNGTRYSFRVYARNVVGLSAATNVSNAVPLSVLTAPRSLTAVPTNLSGQLRLSWTAPHSNAGAAITDYVIQRSANGSTGWTTITDGVHTATTYTVNGLTTGSRYSFRVYARTSRATSPSSPIASAIPRTKPSAARSLTAATTNLSGQVRLTWATPSSTGGAAITDYLIQRSLNGTTWTTVSDGLSTATTYTATGLTNGSRYSFRIFATNAAGTSPSSPVVSATPRTVPSAAPRIDATASYAGYSVAWDAPTSTGGAPITDYIVQINDSGTWITYADGVSAARTTWIAAPGYGCADFRVAARNAAGTGPYSYAWDACYLSAPTAPSGLSGFADSSGYFLDWGLPVSDGGAPITGYVVDYWTGSSWVTLRDGSPADTWDNVHPYIGCVTFRVAASNNVGVGAFRSITVCATSTGPAQLQQPN